MLLTITALCAREHKSLDRLWTPASLSPSKLIFSNRPIDTQKFLTYLNIFSFSRGIIQVQPSDANRPRFVAVTSLEDVQAVRCAEFHPNGSVYAIGSNSKTFRICEYPQLSEIRFE